MISELEKFLGNYPNIINFLVAIGTISVVISSLYFSKLSLKPKAKAFLYISQLWLPIDTNQYRVQEDEEFILLNVCNKGIIPIYIPYFNGFSWYFLLNKTAWIQNALKPVFKDKEFEISQYKSESFVLCKYSDFIEKIKKDLIEKEKYPLFLLRFIKFKIRTSNNEVIIAKFDKKLINRILIDVK